MPHHPRLEAQLRAVVSRPMPGGGYRITSPRRPDGSHGDLVSAVVLATWAASQQSTTTYRPFNAHGTGSRWAGMPDRGF